MLAGLAKANYGHLRLIDTNRERSLRQYVQPQAVFFGKLHVLAAKA